MRAPPMLLIGVLICICVAPSCAQVSLQSKHARVELLAAHAAESSGKFLVGVHFTLEKGWHIYWANPGDSGQPPSFQWTLPSGATAGEIEWPRPERLQSSPDIADYGYEHDVLLLVPIHLPASQDKSTGRNIGLQAKWLICREVCLPDHAQLSISLSEASTGSPRTAELFARSQAMLPRQWPKGWKAMVKSQKNDFVLTLDTGRPLSHVQFFPLEAGQIENAAKQRISTTKTGAKLLLRKSDLLLKPIAELRGVLVIGAQAYQLRAAVVAQAGLK